MPGSARLGEVSDVLRCRQVTEIVAGGELIDAGPWLRMKIRLHLMMCRHCARYAKQIRTLGVAARERFRRPDETSVQELQRKILESAGNSETKRKP